MVPDDDDEDDLPEDDPPEDEEDEEEEEEDEGEEEEEEEEEDEGEEEDEEEEDEEDEEDEGEQAEEDEGEEEEAENEEEEGEGEEGEGEEARGEEDDGVSVDEAVYGSRDEYPDAEDEDFEEDAGDWSDADYEESAERFFGQSEHFGEPVEARWVEQGYAVVQDDDAYRRGFEETIRTSGVSGAPSVSFFQKDDRIVPMGFVTIAALAVLRVAYPDLDLSQLHVTVPERPRTNPDEPRGLPPSLAHVSPADKVDLRQYCSPVGDQGQTSRCSAFAWTHAMELCRRIARRDDATTLSCSYTMLQFQRKQGDARDFRWAHEGGDGTEPGPAMGRVLVERGTCRSALWPDDDPGPLVAEDVMAGDALAHRLEAEVFSVGVDDLKPALTAGCPVHLSMNTGDAFSDLGRDGVFDVAERPSGQHGRHAMLIVGYVGNYFIVKNSWGTDWGDAGYCYVPKKVLVDAEAELVAIRPKRPPQADPPPVGRFCTGCGVQLLAGMRFCANCGTKVV